ncbi:MAG: 23S rRNA (adenine(1618)-N(6))-methyltransferase RlmF, partial [Saprospiraceae bacterium]
DWDIPAGYLCPPIPGRADYLHYLADLLAEGATDLQIPLGKDIRILDIGTGANLIYPIIGEQVYQWSFVGAEIDQQAVGNAHQIIEQNTVLTQVEIRPQIDPKRFFRNIIGPNERFSATICNPPFYLSAEAAHKATNRKIRNLKGKKTKEKRRNFGGQPKELWCRGGEEKFIKKMILESVEFSKNVGWFTTLVAKKEHLASIEKILKKVNAREYRVIEMGQGNKKSRLVVWRF